MRAHQKPGIDRHKQRANESQSAPGHCLLCPSHQRPASDETPNGYQRKQHSLSDRLLQSVVNLVAIIEYDAPDEERGANGEDESYILRNNLRQRFARLRRLRRCGWPGIRQYCPNRRWFRLERRRIRLKNRFKRR